MLLEDDVLARSIGEALLARSAKIAVAETTAGGLISARLLSVPGASAWFERGIVAYSGAAKQQATGANADVLKTHGAVSEEAVSAMAEGLRTLAGVAYAIAESGIAGPIAGRRSPKPVGTVVIALATPNGTILEHAVVPGSRVEVMQGIAQRALELLARHLAQAGSA